MTADAVGGVWTYATDLAAGLVRYGVSTTLVVAGPCPSDSQRNRAAEIKNLRVIGNGHDLDWCASSEDVVRLAAESVSAFARNERADIIHFNSPSLAALAQFDVPVLGACHSCLATWWYSVGQGPMPEDFAWRTALLARGYAACDGLVAPSRSFAVRTTETYGVDVSVVHNGRTPDVADKEPPRERCVLTAGRLWDSGKNVTSFDGLASLLDCPAYAAGTLAAGEGLYHAIALGLLDAAALRERMSRSRVFVSLARYEPFGLAVLEAAQSGCALVLSDIASFRELWDGAALFVEPSDCGAAAAAAQSLLDDSAFAERMARAARRRAEAYTVEAMSERMMALYRLIGSKAGAMA